MFTGIIQGQGEIVGLRRSGQECRMEVRPLFPLENIVDGESIAHNGACLSVERHSGSTFTVYASGEHLVSGHVDCVATVRSVDQAGSSLRCTLAFPPAFAAEVIEKGSVTLDGISLTINACGKDFLTVNVIPDTQKRTTMLHWRPGSRVNMETDLIGKYVRRIMQCQADGPAAPQKSSGINKEFLLQNGFL